MKIRVLLVSVLAITLSGCSSKRWNPDEYPVRSGDTIYSIAWKYELDPFELAQWNGIASPFRIYPGQRLKMKSGKSDKTPQPKQKVSGRRTTSARDAVTVRKGDSLYLISERYDVSVRQLASINGLKSPYIIHPGQTLKLKPSKTYRSAPAATPQKTTTASLPSDNRRISWQWPVRGKLITTFKSNKTDRKGIDIAGREGKTIRAAASGKVVYSGNGLISYGNLVIIKHNRTYLSAYAHNRRLLVKEGESIQAGQKIAELGMTGTDSPRLHFEIRKNGKPVNPLKYLPSS